MCQKYEMCWYFVYYLSNVLITNVLRPNWIDRVRVYISVIIGGGSQPCQNVFTRVPIQK